MEFKDRLKSLRIKNGLSQAILADMLDVSSLAQTTRNIEIARVIHFWPLLFFCQKWNIANLSPTEKRPIAQPLGGNIHIMVPAMRSNRTIQIITSSPSL